MGTSVTRECRDARHADDGDQTPHAKRRESEPTLLITPGSCHAVAIGKA